MKWHWSGLAQGRKRAYAHPQADQLTSPKQHDELRNWCIAFAIGAAGVIASCLWLDQPIALFVHRNVTEKALFIWLQRLPVSLPLLSLFILAWCGFWSLMNRPASRVQSVALACSISFLAASLVTNHLKYAFGRTWPDTWIDDNPSLIQSGVFGFNPFHGGIGFAAFPSGHAASLCAVMAVLWSAYPSWRPVYIACVAATAIGLIGANYHFLSDILAGGLVGVFVGYVTTKMTLSRDVLRPGL
jgi:membrane-associated phospholipid phosphatase